MSTLRIKMELEGPPGSRKTTIIEDVIKALNGLPPKQDFLAEFWTRQSKDDWQMEAMAGRKDGVYTRPTWPTQSGIERARRIFP